MSDATFKLIQSNVCIYLFLCTRMLAVFLFLLLSNGEWGAAPNALETAVLFARSVFVSSGTLLYFAALRHVPLSDAATISILSPILTVTLTPLLEASIRLDHLKSLLLSVGGVALILKTPFLTSLDAPAHSVSGYAMLLGSVLLDSVSNIISRFMLGKRNMSPAWVLGTQIVTYFVIFTPLVPAFNMNIAFMSCILTSGLCTFLNSTSIFCALKTHTLIPVLTMRSSTIMTSFVIQFLAFDGICETESVIGALLVIVACFSIRP